MITLSSFQSNNAPKKHPLCIFPRLSQGFSVKGILSLVSNIHMFTLMLMSVLCLSANAAFSSAFFLVDTDTNEHTLLTGASLNQSELPDRFSISFNPSSTPSVTPVEMSLKRVESSGELVVLYTNSESLAPYTLFGDEVSSGVFTGRISEGILKPGNYIIFANDRELPFRIVQDASENNDMDLIDPDLLQLSSSHKAGDLWKAKDSDQSTRWTTYTNQDQGQYIQIEFPSEMNVNSIKMVTAFESKGELDYPRAYTVFVSSDAINWEEIQSGSGSDTGTTTIDLINATAKYIKIEQIGYDRRFWWSIYDLEVYASTIDEPIFPPKDPLIAPFAGTIFIEPNIMTAADPTTFQSIEPAGQGIRTLFDRRSGWITVNAYLFNAYFDDELSFEIQVNPEFQSVENALVEANKYAPIIGQLPTELRKDVDAIWIHKGDNLSGGGNRSILIHTEQADKYAEQGILEEVLVHEAAHTSLDAGHAYSSGWNAAQTDDITFISDYARDFPFREDIAESFLLYLALKFKADRISKELKDSILYYIPNRIEYFDDQSFDMYPLNSK